MKKNIYFFLIFLIFPLTAFALSTNGTIDSTYKYAWGENIGWLNFGCSSCNVTVTDTNILGYAWNENYGWINLNPSNSGIKNDGKGNLSGYAWGENLGWIDFSKVTINFNGEFFGYAIISKDNSKINFNCANANSCNLSDFKVKTNWRPKSVVSTFSESTSSSAETLVESKPLLEIVSSTTSTTLVTSTISSSTILTSTTSVTSTPIILSETIKAVMEKVGEVIADQVQKIVEALPEPVQKAAKAVKQGTIIVAKAVGIAAKVTAETAVITAKVANEIRENPVTQQVNKTIVTPIVGAGAAVNALPIISTIVLSDPLHLLLYFLSYISEAIGIRKKRHPWGIVYDSLTKEPLPFSAIRIFEEKTHKLCETHVTDRKGRFGFLIVPGKYYLLIQKTNYSFPSQKIKGISDESFTDLYHGEILEIKEEEGFIKVNIPLDQILVEGQKVKKNIFRLFLYFLEKIGTPLLMPGTILAGISLLISIKPLNFCIFALYLFLFLAKEKLKVEREISWGKVYDSENKKGIEIAQVQLFDKKWETLIEIQTTDRFGRFGFFVEKAGEYFIKVIKEEYQFPSQKIKGISDGKYNNLYYGETIYIKKDKQVKLKMNIPIDRISL